MSFGGRLDAAIATYGNLCVGIDPHPALLEAWGLPVTAAGAERFADVVIDAASGRVAAVKPQVALFEAYGSQGFAALERVLERAAHSSLMVIADAKRGDIGSTNAGYAAAWLSDVAPFTTDALTISPYLGPHALDVLVDTAVTHDKGVYMLAATSNPEAAVVQRATGPDGRSVAELAIGYASDHVHGNAEGVTSTGDVGVVVGATIEPLVLANAWAAPHAQFVPILAPGFGAQGASLQDFHALYGAQSSRTLANVSRSILRAGADKLVQAINNANRELAQ